MTDKTDALRALAKRVRDEAEATALSSASLRLGAIATEIEALAAQPAASVGVEGLRSLSERIRPGSEAATKQRAREYTVIRPDGTHYRADEGGARMAAKREGYRVLMEAALSERGEAVACIGCEDSPAPENNPCGVCGRNAPPAPLDVAALRGLVEKWTKRASAYGHAGYTGVFSEGRSGAQRECADELESILASGEAGSG